MNEFKDYKGIIYKITNLIDNKCYIGQTIYSFNHRYRMGKWWKYTTNRYLKNAVNKYGINNFIVDILEFSKDLDTLNRLEEEYSKKFNSVVPNGYNLTFCGKSKLRSEESINLYTKEIVLNNPDNIDVKIKNIKKFCRDNGLNERSLYRVIEGKFSSHKGWSLQGNTNKIHKNKKSYAFFNIKGERFDIIGLIDFCKLNNLNYYNMRDMVNGKIQQSQGYALEMENFNKRRKEYKITLINEENDTIELNSIKKDCRKYNLHYSLLYKLINNKISEYKGWKIKEIKLRY